MYSTIVSALQALEPDLERSLGAISETRPKYSLWTKIKVLAGMAHKGWLSVACVQHNFVALCCACVVYYIDSLVDGFFAHFNKQYEAALAMDFESMPLTELMDYLKHLYEVSTWTQVQVV